MTCPDVPRDLGAYVLGALDPDERRRSRSTWRLRPLRRRARRVRRPAGPARPRPPRGPAAGRRHAVARSCSTGSRRRRRAPAGRRGAGVAAGRGRRAGRWLGVGVGVIVWAAGQGSDTVTASPGPVQVTMTATRADEGTALDVTVAGLRPGETCRLVAVDGDGARTRRASGRCPTDGDGAWRGWADRRRATTCAKWCCYGDGDRELCGAGWTCSAQPRRRAAAPCRRARWPRRRRCASAARDIGSRRSTIGRTTPRSTSGHTSCSTAATISALPPGPVGGRERSVVACTDAALAHQLAEVELGLRAALHADASPAGRRRPGRRCCGPGTSRPCCRGRRRCRRRRSPPAPARRSPRRGS